MHLLVFIWGFTPVLGRYITLDAWQIVWYRLLITVFTMFLYILFSEHIFSISRILFLKLSGVGIIILIHWLTFYGAIKVSNISVTMVAFSTGTLFSSVIEPVFFKRRIRSYEVIIGLIIIAAIAMIFSIESKYWLGIIFGMLAALTSATFSVFNSILARDVKPVIISFYELFAALIGLTFFLFINGNFVPKFFVIDNASLVALFILSLVCTVFPFISSVNLSRFISPYTIVLTVNLETVYGIIWAIIFFNENKEVKPSFYIGVVIILAAIFLNSYLKKLSENKV